MNQKNGKLMQAKNGQRVSQLPRSKSPALTPAEMTEAARFKAMTAARAARQAMLFQIMAEMMEVDQPSPAA
ncbi:MAG: hypothetical protein JW953_23520 [Anaerolineae bacterium]|nr:hypothetical protein [Anaerolineae bacterium]